MIQINLLKKTANKKRVALKLSQRQKMLLGIIFSVLVIGLSGFQITKMIASSKTKKESRVVIKDDFSPSSFVSPHVEEVVRDRNDASDKLTTGGILNIPYEQLSFIEKTNYEILYAKNVFDMLSRTIISGVDFKEIEFCDYKTLHGLGLSKSKDKVRTVFKTLRSEKLVLLPKPQTQISKKGEYYQFKIAGITDFRLNLHAPFLVASDDMIAYDDLDMTLKKFVDAADGHRINIQSGPNRIDAFVLKKYRRFHYTFTATSTYSRFVSYINNLYDSEIPCAFKKLSITALSSSTVKIEAEIIFTTSY